jgi:hypothetical protein
MKLIKAAGFTSLKKKEGVLKVEVVAQNLEDLVANSAELREMAI